MRSKRHFRVLLTATILMFAMIAADCQSTPLPAGQSIATFTRTAVATITVGPTHTPPGPPTETPIPSATPYSGPYIVANLGVQVRAGPTTGYPVVGLLKQGDQAPLIGRAAGGLWLAIEYPAAPNSVGYILETLVSVYGDRNAVPLFNQFATLPTKPPTATVPASLTPMPTIPVTPSLTPVPATATNYPVTFTADASNVVWDKPCTWVRWDVTGVQGVFLDGEGLVAGQTSHWVCPEFPQQTYTLSVVRLNDSIETYTVTITNAGVPGGKEKKARECLENSRNNPSYKCK
ncbi:MAG: SH3 domain-containing protein [Chloroflexi bacterium]|nr:SH3 domain-containing protein [Chloroflexota bacterium]MBI3764565.1 SH3 domain-containing protein [Chloroflexota bacterium]